MPNKLPELYLYRLIPGAKQPSRWNIKSRYPVPVVPPAPPSDQNLDNDELLAIDEPTAPGKPTLTYSPGQSANVSPNSAGKLTVTAGLRITFPQRTGGSAPKSYNIYMVVNGGNVAQLHNSIPPTPTTPNFIDIPTYTIYYDRIDDMDKISFTASVNYLGETSEISDPISFLATLREFYRSKNY